MDILPVNYLQSLFLPEEEEDGGEDEKPADKSNMEIMLEGMINSWRLEIMLSEGGWPDESKIEW
ncbi:hypothetical protein [Pantoea sp. B65]|uniref:hypothetical protein n=1 Tax=Pantoea sp. B65 TaxID=2813359 RepID=UPI0039B467DF